MSDEANSDQNSGSGRRRKRRRGRNRGGSASESNANAPKTNGSGGSGGSSNRDNSGNKGQSRGRRSGGGGGGGGRRSSTPQEKFGGREPRDANAGRREGPTQLNAFELFCAYHLGIFEDNTYRDPSLKSVARLFGRSLDDIRDALVACGLDDQAVRKSDYDLSLAQLDVKVAPEGIDKREVAKTLFDEFVEAHSEFVDWSEEAVEESEADDSEADDSDVEDSEADDSDESEEESA